MSDPSGPSAEELVLVLAPTARDAVVTTTILAEAGVKAVPCANMNALCQKLAEGVGVAVLTGEAVVDDHAGCLATAVETQPPWSDIPLIVLTDGGADSPAAALAFETLGNVTLLDRPVRVATLVSAVRAALRSRLKQYEVRDHLAERVRIAAELVEAAARKDEFIAMLAHELRNPLGPVRNALAVLQLRLVGDPATARLGEMMERQIQHLVRLVDDLLDVSRIARGKVELQRERLDLAAIVARSAEGVGAFLKERQHWLEVGLPSGPLWAEADPDRVEQIVTNLLTNAGKYTRPGGHVWVTVTKEGSEGVISVRDDGIGIRADALPRLFDMFMQSDRLPGCVSDGLGLGLALVRSLVELHGGTVTASSDGPGQGSEFVVRLPLLPPATSTPQPAVEQPAATKPDFRQLRVLVCDDNEDGAESLATLLELVGHEVRVCYDGPAALVLARESPPDVCLLDIGLPKGMDGHEVARRLRSDGLGSAFLVALTGYGQDEDRQRSTDAGFQAHLVKPVDHRVLSELLSRVP